MPLYDYQCPSCGKTCEILQKSQNDPLPACPYCGQSELQRKVSAPRFQLKGSGWYVTDFKNKDKPAAATKTETSDSSDKNPEKAPEKDATGKQSQEES